MIRRFLRQGSWAQRTIIKPQPGHEFDADVLVEMKQQRTWADDPKQYLLAVHDALQTAPRYRSRVELKTRCVRVVYAGDCHVDLVPYVHTSGWFERHEIVARIMRSAGLRADKVRRDFTVDAANLNSRWCGDITYISTWEGWLYLATVIDIASRRVVGYAMADHLRTGLVADALGNAVAARDPAPGVIFHSDRGCQYTSAAFGGLAGDFHVELSHGRTGQCWDNALAESFFGSIKGELIDLQAWPTRAAARRAVVEYIGWYNGTRLHSSLGYLSPAEFEASHRNEIKNVA